MSLFFTLAGCSAAISASHSVSIRQFVTKRFISVFIPYTTWSFLGGVQYASLEQIQKYSLVHHLHTFLCGDVMQWFLICLFVLQLLYALYKWITFKIQHPTFRIIIASCLFIMIFLMHRIWGRTSEAVPYWTPEFLTNAYIYFIPFAIGVIIIEYPRLFARVFQHRLVIFFAVIISLFGIRLYAHLPSNYPRLITGICITLLIINLTQKFDFKSIHTPWAKFVITHMILFGKYSLVIYLFHSSLLPAEALSSDTWGVGILPFIVMMLIAWVVCYICIGMERLIALSPLCALLMLGKKRAKKVLS